MFKLAFLGDIVGRPGRAAAKLAVQRLLTEYNVDLIIANAENAAHGKGITEPTVQELFHSGIGVLTGGNHTWAKKGIKSLLEYETRVIRPLNYPARTAGRGIYTYEVGRRAQRVTVINVLGRVFMEPLDCPFACIDKALESLAQSSNIILVDFHAEATSEKLAMGRFLDGRVSAVIGTHTHVPTADPQILTNGTAYITDAGMCGPTNSILGVRSEIILQKFLTSMPVRFDIEEEGPLVAAGVMIDCDTDTSRAARIEQFVWDFGK